MRTLILALVLLCIACAQVPAREAASYEIKSEEAVVLMRQKGTLVLDVRSPDEALTGRVPQAKTILFGPLRWTERPISGEDVEIFLSEVREKFPDKEASLIIFCNIGIRSQAATEALVSDGYKNAKAVKQGFLGNHFGQGLEFLLLAR